MSYLKVARHGITASNFDFEASSITVTATAEPARVSFGLGTGTTTERAPGMSKLEMNFPTHAATAHDIDFLLTENLFAAKGGLIKVDEGQGLRIPHDGLILGQIAWTTADPV